MSRSRKLDEFKGKASSGSIDVKINRDILEVSGYVCGSGVEEITGDWDHEFGLRVLPENVRTLSRLLNVRTGDDEDLLDSMVKMFACHEGKSYSAIKEYLKDNAIDFDDWVWS